MRFSAAVIFDVDGVLLDLTPEEEDAFAITTGIR
jgi:FMN phosphatase YigB (HAD superfamily)